MKKQFAWIMAGAIVLSLAALPGYGQVPKDAQQILNKMIDAQGGRKALESIKDSTTTGTAELPQYGMSGTVTVYQKEPNKIRMDIEIGGMVITQAYDGQKAWMTNPQNGGAVEEMHEAQAKEMARQALVNDAMMNPQKYGISYAVKPKVKLQDKEYLVLEQTMSDGHKTTLYLDPATYLPYKLDTTGMGQSGGEAKIETFMSDYRKVGDAMVAYGIRTLQDGAEFMVMTISKITYNTGLEDSMFAMSK